jgi:hypothetical protein
MTMTGVTVMSNPTVILTVYVDAEAVTADIRREYWQPTHLSDPTRLELLYLIGELLKEADLPKPHKVVWGEGDHYVVVYPKHGGGFFGVSLPRYYRERLRDYATLIRLSAPADKG